MIYGDWLISRMVMQKFTVESHSVTKYNLDVLERWLINLYNKNKTISSPDKDYREILDEFKDHGWPEKGPVMAEALEFITKPIEYEYDYVFSDNEFRCHNFSLKLDPARLAELIKRGGKKATGDMILQYATIMLRESNFWSVSPEDYKKLQAKYGATVEGFASPLNSQFMMLRPENSQGGDLKFCSVLPIDKKFGSLGSFFDQKFKNEVVICNPPFINDFMLRVVKFAEKCNGKFIFVVPTRPGTAFYDKLKSSKRFGGEEIWEKKTYFYVHNFERIRASFDTSIILFLPS